MMNFVVAFFLFLRCRANLNFLSFLSNDVGIFGAIEVGFS